MCGRTACTLCPEDIKKACSYKNSASGKFEQPEWIESDSERKYSPSHNVAPTDVTPVLISGRHFRENKRCIKPMMWGMIPPWHKGDYKSHGMSTNNCRIENLTSSKLYLGPFSKGLHCVVVCDGFYEWQTTKGKSGKVPYFIYMSQNNGVLIDDQNTWSNEWNEDAGWKGLHLLHMAALFNTWISPEGEKIYSYSIITMESNATFSWLHHRMPAVLNSDQIKIWLDEDINVKDLKNILQPQKLQIIWHEVTTLVNNSRNKDPNCIKRITEDKTKQKSKSNTFMDAWLKRSHSQDSESNVKNKIPKEEKEGSENNK